jgi:hypothetical protein
MASGWHNQLLAGDDVGVEPIQIGVERAYFFGLLRERGAEFCDEPLVVGPEHYRPAVEVHPEQGFVLDDVDIGFELVHQEAVRIEAVLAEPVHQRRARVEREAPAPQRGAHPAWEVVVFDQQHGQPAPRE